MKNRFLSVFVSIVVGAYLGVGLLTTPIVAGFNRVGSDEHFVRTIAPVTGPHLDLLTYGQYPEDEYAWVLSPLGNKLIDIKTERNQEGTRAITSIRADGISVHGDAVQLPKNKKLFERASEILLRGRAAYMSRKTDYK